MVIRRWWRRRTSCGGFGFAFVLQRRGESLNGGEEEVRKEMKNGYRRENGKKEREGEELREEKK